MGSEIYPAQQARMWVEESLEKQKSVPYRVVERINVAISDAVNKGMYIVGLLLDGDQYKLVSDVAQEALRQHLRDCGYEDISVDLVSGEKFSAGSGHLVEVSFSIPRG